MGNFSGLVFVDNYVGERRVGTLVRLGQPVRGTATSGSTAQRPVSLQVLTEDGTFIDGNFVSCPGRCAWLLRRHTYEIAPTCTAPCLPGHYCPENTSVPIPCPVGTHNPEEGAAAVFACVYCSAEQYSDILGNAGYCVCAPEYYDTRRTSPAPTCARCPIGTNCTTPNITVESMPMRYGYWRPVMTSANNVTICPDADSFLCMSGWPHTYKGHGGRSARSVSRKTLFLAGDLRLLPMPGDGG